jgi:hypothetical protein
MSDNTSATEGKIVAREEFMSIIVQHRLNVHPTPYRDHTKWKYLDGRQQLWAVTKPGYSLEGPHEYRILGKPDSVKKENGNA